MAETGGRTLADSVDRSGVRPRDLGLRRGELVGRFVVLERLGAGGMGEVFLCFDPELDRRVAVKLLRSRGGDGDQEEARARHLREARAIAKLSHPNVVGVHDVAIWNDRVFLAMEYVQGETLGAWSLARRGDWRAITSAFIGAGEGLIAAHGAGLIHRDFKPENVLVDRAGRARVLDFGIARAIEGGETGEHAPLRSGDAARVDAVGMIESGLSRDARLTTTGMLIGTPAYMAPEQFLGGRVDERSDQFSFCVSLWEALYGQRPFSGASVGALAVAVGRGVIASVPKEAGVPAFIEQALRRGLSVDPEQRHPSMRALLEALSPPHEVDAPARSGTRWIYGVAALALAAAVGWILAGRTDPVETCVGGRALLDDATGPDARKDIRDRFAQVGGTAGVEDFERVAALVDAWGRRWFDARRRACAATHAEARQSAESLELRLACLDRQRQELGARAELWREADREVVRRSVETAAGLPRPEACDDAVELRRRTAQLEGEAAAEWEAIEALLPRARALVAAGRYAAATEALAEPLDRARALDEPGLLAEVLYEVGRTQELSGAPQPAKLTLRESLRRAVVAGRDDVAAEAALGLVTTVGITLSRFDEGENYLDLAEGLAARLPEGGEQMRFQRVACNYLNDRGKQSQARPHCERAVALGKSLFGERSLEHAGALLGLANNHLVARDPEPAAALLERAWAIEVGLLGPTHPRLVRTANSRAVASYFAGDMDAAIARWAEACAIADVAYGPGSVDGLGAHLNLSVVSLERGDWARAQAEIAEVERVFAGPKGELASEKVFIHSVRGQLALVTGDVETARAHFELELEFALKTRASDHPEVAQASLDLAHVLLLQQATDLADPHVDRALALSQTLDDHSYRPRALVMDVRRRLAREDLAGAAEVLDRLDAALAPASVGESAPPGIDRGEALAYRGRLEQRNAATRDVGVERERQGRAMLASLGPTAYRALQGLAGGGPFPQQ